jgi:hypothetical protein
MLGKDVVYIAYGKTMIINVARRCHRLQAGATTLSAVDVIVVCVDTVLPILGDAKASDDDAERIKGAGE